jgi:hypothetical protein
LLFTFHIQKFTGKAREGPLQLRAPKSLPPRLSVTRRAAATQSGPVPHPAQCATAAWRPTSATTQFRPTAQVCRSQKCVLKTSHTAPRPRQAAPPLTEGAAFSSLAERLRRRPAARADRTGQRRNCQVIQHGVAATAHAPPSVVCAAGRTGEESWGDNRMEMSLGRCVISLSPPPGEGELGATKGTK